MTHHHYAFALACFAGLSAFSFGAEYVGSDVPGMADSSGRIPTATDNLGRIPGNAYEQERFGIKQSSLFRDTGAPYYNSLRDVQVTPEIRASESVTFSGAVDVPDFRGRFPLLQRGFAPENADLKIGPLYFKLRHLGAAVLHSDNVFRDDARKESDTLALFSIGGQVMAQLSEGFRIAIAGNFVYLPFEGDAGPNGFSVVAPYAFGLAGTPSAAAQVAWEPVIFGLPFVIADEFKMGLARFTNNGYDSFELFEGFETDSVDSSGIYSLRAPTTRSFRDSGRDADAQTDFETTYYSNEISVSTAGRLPGQNIFRFRASHEDIWYEEEGSGLPSQRDRVFFGAESVRESLRFKPFASYEWLRTADPDRSTHQVRAGVKGPITDLLYFRGDLGYYWDDKRGDSNTLWSVALHHTPNPRTRQSLVYQRSLSDFLEELDERATYRITRTLGPNLKGAAYASYHWIEDLDGAVPDREELRTGVTFNYIWSPKTTYRLTGQYARIAYDDDSFGSYDDWRGRFECRHQFRDNLYGRFIYQYEVREGDIISPDYTENLFFLSLSYSFD